MSQYLSAQNIFNLGKHELGLNVNSTLQKVVFNSEEEINPQVINFDIPIIYNTVVTYRYYYSENFAMRMGLGYYYQDASDTISNIFRIQSFTHSYQQFSANFGYQRQFKLGEKVQVYTGMDLIFRNRKHIQKGHEIFFGFIPEEYDYKNTQNFNLFGFGVPIGVQFYFSDKISISTEMNLETSLTFYKERYNTSNQSEPFYSDPVRYTKALFRVPAALFLNLRF